MRATDRVVVCDTTLCGGAHAPGVALSRSERVEVADQLVRLGVDVVEAGWPASGAGERAAVEAVARAVRGVVVAARCHADEDALDEAWQVLECAERPRLHLAVHASPTLREHAAESGTQLVARVARAVAHARDLCGDVQLTVDDAPLAEPGLLAELCAAGAGSGATTVCLADTVGLALPEDLVDRLTSARRVPGGDGVTWAVRPYDDLGLATATALSAVRAGARQVEVAVNGLGPRAGHAPLEAVVVALRTHRATLGADTRVETRELARTARLVAMLSGYPVPAGAAVTGANALARDTRADVGARAAAAAYEVVTPADVGAAPQEVVLAGRAGREAFVRALGTLGLSLPRAVAEHAFRRFEELAARKSSFTDADLVALATEESGEDVAAEASAYHFDWLAVAGGTDTPPRATVRLSRGDETVEADATGDGMIDAACNAVASACGVDAALVSFQVAAVTPGTDAVGDVSVQVDVAGARVNARGVSTDVVEASARAFLHAINKVAGGTAVPHRTDVP